MNSARDHSDPVKEALVRMASDQRTILAFGAEFFSVGTPMFPLDWLAAAAIKRNLSTTSAISLLVSAWNMQAARSLLRIHIDTALRFSAAWLVEKPHDFAMDIFKGARIDKYLGMDGRPLKDFRLVEARSLDHPWLSSVYENLSGYVHFSGSHVYDSMRDSGDNEESISFYLSENDEKFPDSSWIEVIDCAREATGMLMHYLNGYALTKSLTSEELAALRAGRDIKAGP